MVKALINLDCGETTCDGCHKNYTTDLQRCCSLFDGAILEKSGFKGNCKRLPECLASTNQVITVGDLENSLDLLAALKSFNTPSDFSKGVNQGMDVCVDLLKKCLSRMER